MRVEISKSKRAICCICGNIIEDNYRIFDCGNNFDCSNRATLYYHISCIIETAKKLSNSKDLEERVRKSWRRGVHVSKL